MKKTNTYSSFIRSASIMLAFCLITFVNTLAMDPVGINFLYVAGTTTVVNPDTIPGWNTVSHYQNWSSRSGLVNMKDVNGVVTNLGIKITTDFYGTNSSGASSTTIGMVDNVSKTNFYGNTANPGGVTLSGLNPGVSYKISIFGSRNGTASNADVVYTLNDALKSNITLSCANNITGLAIFNNIIPNTDGSLVINLSKGAANTIGYTYLAAIKVEEVSSVPVGFLPIKVNFGPTAVAGWNTLTSFASNAALNNMSDTGGNATNISLVLNTGFYGITGTSGMGSTTTSLSMPDEVSKSNMYKNASGGAFSITGLDAGKKYKFSIFASRAGLTEPRSVIYVINDENGSSVELDVANNDKNLAILDQVSPNADGSLTFTLNFASNNTAYSYISAMMIDTASVSTGVSSIGLEKTAISAVRSGNSVRLIWNNSENQKAFVRIYNLDGKLIKNISVSGSNSVDVELENNGMYITKIQSGESTWMSKFIY